MSFCFAQVYSALSLPLSLARSPLSIPLRFFRFSLTWSPSLFLFLHRSISIFRSLSLSLSLFIQTLSSDSVRPCISLFAVIWERKKRESIVILPGFNCVWMARASTWWRASSQKTVYWRIKSAFTCRVCRRAHRSRCCSRSLSPPKKASEPERERAKVKVERRVQRDRSLQDEDR